MVHDLIGVSTKSEQENKMALLDKRETLFGIQSNVVLNG